MTNLGPQGMKQYLRTQAKRQDGLERGMGGLLRPKAGVPLLNDDGNVTFDPLRTNDLSRYGSRLVVWNFSFLLAANPPANYPLAKLPGTFWPDQPVLDTAWANLGSSTNVAFLYLQNTGWLYFNSSLATTVTSISGGIKFTASL